MSLSRLTALIAMLLAATAVQGTTIRVPSEQPTIQEAVNHALASDVILVAFGQYNEHVTVSAKSLSIISEDGRDFTTVFSDTSRALTVVEGADVFVQGFTLTGTSAQPGGGVFAENSNLSLFRCAVLNCTAVTSGGGICAFGSNTTLTDCLIRQNEVFDDASGVIGGGGIYSNGALVVDNCTVEGNTIAEASSEPHGFHHLDGGGIYSTGSPAAIRNSTIRGNLLYHGQGTGGGVYLSGDGFTLENNLIKGNTMNTGADYGSNVFGGGVSVLGSNGNIDGNRIIANAAHVRDVRFATADAYGGGLYLQGTGNTVVNNLFLGNSASAGGHAYEYSGDPRAYGGGCYVVGQNQIRNNTIVNNQALSWLQCEDYPVGDPTLYAQGGGCYSDQATIERNIIVLNDVSATITVSGDDPGTAAFHLEGAGFYGIGSANDCNDCYGNIGASDWLGDYSATNISSDPLFCDGDYSIMDISECAPLNNSCGVLIGALDVACAPYTGPVWHVAVDGEDRIGFGSADNPFATIQYAIDAASSGDTVLVHPGTYTGTGNIDISTNGKAIIILGRDGRDATVIDGEELGVDGFLVDGTAGGTTTVISGFTLRGFQRGIELLGNASPLLQDLELNMNSIAGIGNEMGEAIPVPVITDCWFYSNAQGIEMNDPQNANIIECQFNANAGAAIRVDGYGFSGATSVKVSGCQFAENGVGFDSYDLWEGNGSGGEEYCLIDDCLFVNNGVAVRGMFTLTNSVIDQGTNGFEGNDTPYAHGYKYSVSNCTIENLTGTVIQAAEYTTISDCTIRGNAGSIATSYSHGDGYGYLNLLSCTIDNNGGGIQVGGCGYGLTTIDGCQYTRNGGSISGGMNILHSGLAILNSTIAHNNANGVSFSGGPSGPYGSPQHLGIFSSIVAFNQGTGIEWTGGGETTYNISCSDVYGNVVADYSGIPDQAMVNNNMSLDPLFCHPETGNFYVDDLSACESESPLNNCGALIGAWPANCGIHPDNDADGITDSQDNCPDDHNPSQIDSDGDGHADACDNCPEVANEDQANADGDSAGDACDICDGSDDLVDNDGDTVPDGCDVCPGFNDMTDPDGDTVPDGCDICPGFDDRLDSDMDGVPDGCDNCPDDFNPGQEDTDGDQIGDLCDEGGTSIGSDVEVPISADITLIFDSVDVGGVTTVTTFSSDSLGHPGGFRVLPTGEPLYYDILTSAELVDSFTICFTYDESLVTGREENLKLWHWEGSPPAPRDITVTVDAASNVICGRAGSLSAFGLGEQTCCSMRVGDVNGLGGDEPTIGDISVLIDHLFILRPPLDCYDEADINQSGELFPVRNDITIGDISTLIDYLFITGQSLGLPECL